MKQLNPPGRGFALRSGWMVAAAAALACVPMQGHAYQFFKANTGGCKWAAIGAGNVDFLIDASSTTAKSDTLLEEMTTVRKTWHDITTARDVVGNLTKAAVDFTDANYGTAWGLGPASGAADGQNEVALDETGDIIRLFGLDPATLNGLGMTRRSDNADGSCTISDAMLILNGTRALGLDTKVHEMGHILGLAHSSVGQFNSRNAAAFSGGYGSPSSALKPVNVNSLPVMHPFSISGVSRLPLKADDIAGISTLYPEASAATALATISGTVSRCSDNKPAAGINVRAVKSDDASVQVTRYSAFDNNATGRFEIKGLPPGNYDVIVEEMGHNGFTKERMAIVSALDQGFPFEYYGPTAADEAGCAEDTKDAALPVAAAAGGSESISVKLNDGVRLAFVVDDTGSMSSEISSVREIISRMITTLVDSKEPFPRTSIVTFKDNVTRRIVSDKPTELQAVVDSLSASGGGDCPESSNSALLDAGRLLARGGKAILFTDADSRADGPSAGSVVSYYRARGLSASVLLSATCDSEFTSSSDAAGRGRMGVRRAPRQGQQAGDVVARRGAGAALAGPLFVASRARAMAMGEEYAEPPVLGAEDGLTTYSAIAGPSGGVLVTTSRPNAGDDKSAYINAGLNIGLGSVTTTVMTALPRSGAQGASIDIDLNGSNTNWTSASSVQIVGSSITVGNLRVLSANLIRLTATVPAGQALGFYDVQVTTPLGSSTVETASAIGGFQVTAPVTGGEVTSVSPASGSRGQTFDVTIKGLGTTFTAGSTVQFQQYGVAVPSVTVNSKTLVSATELRANITLAADAAATLLDVSVDGITAGRSFTITEPAPAIAVVSAASPGKAAAGSTGLVITVTGANSHFVGGASTVSFGAGVTVRSVAVDSATQLRATVDLAADAAIGYRDVSVTTGDETAVGMSALQVEAAAVTPEPEKDDGGGGAFGGVDLLFGLLGAIGLGGLTARRRKGQRAH